MTCFAVMLGVSQYYRIDRDLVLGLVGLAILVLLHSTALHRLRRAIPDEEEALGLPYDEESDLGTPTTEIR